MTDFEEAIRINRLEKELDPFALDGAYFSALLACAKLEANPETGVATVARYRKTLPEGQHLAESHDWEKRLQGKLPSLLDKTRGVAG